MEMTDFEVIEPTAPEGNPATGGPITIPSLGSYRSVPTFAEDWCRTVSDLPLIPLRKTPPGRPKGDDRARAAWEPVEPWWERPGDSRGLLKLLREDRDLGVGIRLGRSEAGGPWIVDVLVNKSRVADRELGVGPMWTAGWKDAEGTHNLYIVDDGLQALLSDLGGEGGLIVDEDRFPGVEIRLGSPRVAGSLCVLPPRPGLKGRSRRDQIDFIRELPRQLRERLIEAGATPTIVLGGPSIRTPDPAERESAGEPDRDDEVSWAVEPIEDASAAAVPAGTSPAGLDPDLPELADRIRVAHLDGGRSMARTMDYYRHAGEMLLEAKGRVGHGRFQDWVAANCGFSYRTAADYMLVSLRWPEVERLLAENLQRNAHSTLAGVTKALARPKSPRSPAKGAAARDASERDEVTDGEDGAAGPPADLPDSAGGGRATACRSASPPWDGDEDAEKKTLGSSSPGPSTPGPSDVAPAGPTDPPAVAISLEPGAPWKIRTGDQDGPYPAALGPVRARLEQTGNTGDFDADALAWRLLRPVAGQLRALLDEGAGSYASFVLELSRALPPGEWTLCPTCDGSEALGPGGERCVGCFGYGYKIDPDPDQVPGPGPLQGCP